MFGHHIETCRCGKDFITGDVRGGDCPACELERRERGRGTPEDKIAEMVNYASQWQRQF